MRNRILVLLLIVIVIAAGVFWFVYEPDVAVEIEEVSFEEVQGSEPDISVILSDPEITEGESKDLFDQEDSSSQTPQNDTEQPIEEPAEDQIPVEMNLAVPFTSQAPHANWDLPYQEACEEASAYMVWLYFQGYESGAVDPDIADAALWEMVDYQNATLGDYLDTTAHQTADFIKGFYELNAYVVENPTVEQIKAQIAAGYPVIVPAAGQQLGNPFFSGDGPLYHMLVLRGYTQDQWITNDPGTRRGEAYVYDIDVIMNAMGDWNDRDPANGAKRVIFVEPN